jgi:hypothetical protein
MPDDLPVLSDHGFERAKERLGLSRDAAERTFRKALAEGVQTDETRGRLRRYMDFLRHQYKTRPLIHGNHVWIVGRDKCLVTIFELPHEHRQAAASALSKRPKGGAA